MITGGNSIKVESQGTGSFAIDDGEQDVESQGILIS
jgi:hypothetical protein